MQGEPFRLASATLPPKRLWRFGEPRRSSRVGHASGGGKGSPCKPRTRHPSDHSVYRAAADVGPAYQARPGDPAAFAPVALRRALPKLARRARERVWERVALQATYPTRIGSVRRPAAADVERALQARLGHRERVALRASH